MKPENPVDMSPEAIERRLRDVSQIYKLGKALETAKKIGKVSDISRKEANPPNKK